MGSLEEAVGAIKRQHAMASAPHIMAEILRSARITIAACATRIAAMPHKPYCTCEGLILSA
jgi:hypothetical protein